MAGFIAADGCVRVSKPNKNSINHRLVIALAEKDLDFLTKIQKLINCENPICFYENKLSKRNIRWKDSKIAKLSITSKQIVDDLVKFNIVPNKTLTYDMPDWLLSHNKLHHFIRGYIDGDGSFYILNDPENIHIVFSLRGTMPFLNNVKNILKNEINISTNAKPRVLNGIGQFAIHSNAMIKQLVNWLYNDSTIFLDRKFLIANKASEIIKIQEDAKKRILNILGHISYEEIITDRSR